MHSVTIHHCPVCWDIRTHVAMVMTALLEEGVIAEAVHGDLYEFRVEVDGRTVIDKVGDVLPAVEDVRDAVDSAIWVALPEPAYESVF